MQTRNRSHLSCLRPVRWPVLWAVLLLVLWSCVSHPLGQPRPEPGQETDAQITIVNMRHLDLLFMVDNSPSMKPKQEKMKAQFPKLIEALRDPADHTLPDMRIAIIDSDLGAGQSSSCGGTVNFGDRGQFQMRGAADCGASADARWLEYTKNQPVNFTGDVSKVFGCLAENLGVAGCGFEHQLAALQWAFYLADNQSQLEFLRPEAYLGIVLLTDEDDCSAPPDTAMFNQREKNEAWSLRCGTRSHQCDGTPLTFPTTAAVSVPYASCRARTDATCDAAKVDTSVATDCNPLMRVSELADYVKQLKGGGAEADEKILVAAIYGRQREGDTTPSLYKIDLVPDTTPGTVTPEVWDTWPICYDPDFMPAGSGYDKNAADHGAAGGLRIDAFLKEFPADRSLAYSICEPDYGPAMEGIGRALNVIMGNLCVPFKLVDESDEPGLQPDCRVAYRIPKAVTDSSGKTSIVYEESTASLPMCDASRTPDCWELKIGNENGTSEEKDTAARCEAQGAVPSQMIEVVRKPDSNLPEGTRVVMQCSTCVDMPDGVTPGKGCDY